MRAWITPNFIQLTLNCLGTGYPYSHGEGSLLSVPKQPADAHCPSSTAKFLSPAQERRAAHIPPYLLHGCLKPLSFILQSTLRLSYPPKICERS